MQEKTEAPEVNVSDTAEVNQSIAPALSVGTKEVVSEASVAEAAEASVEQAASDKVETDDFISKLPDDLKKVVEKKNYKTVEDVVKGLDNLQRLASKKISELTPAELKEVYGKMGVPEDASQYEFKVPEGFEATPEMDGFKSMFKELGISKEVGEQLFSKYTEAQVAKVESQYKEAEIRNMEQIEALKKEFGSAYDARIKAAANAALSLGGQEFIDKLAEAGLGSDMAVIKGLVEISKLTSEATAVDGGEKTSFGMTPREADLAIADFRKEYATELNSFNHERHKWAVSELQKLYEIKHG